MNETTRCEVLSSLEFIDESVEESILAVFCSVVQEYDKISIMMDNAEDDYFIYQEGQVWDTATGKGKIENGFFKLIAFIPRLFQGIFNAITATLKKSSEQDVDKCAELAKNVLATGDPAKLQAMSEQVEKSTEDQLGFDPNKKEFVLKRGLKHIRNIIFIATSFPDLFKRFIIRLKGGDSQYDSMIKEITDVLNRKKPVDAETLYASIDTLHQMYKDGYKISMGVRGLTGELSMLLEKKMREDFADGKNVEQQAKAKKLLDEISTCSKHIMSVTFGMKAIASALYVFGGSLYRKFRKGTIDEEDIEMSQTSQEVRDLKHKLKGLKQKYKTLTADKDRKDQKRIEISKLSKQIQNMEDKIANAEVNAEKAKNRDERGDVLWNQTDSSGEKRHALDTGIGIVETRDDLSGIKGLSKESRKTKKALNKDVPEKI